TASVGVGEEHALPMLSSIGGAVDTALLLGPSGAAERTHKGNVRVRGMDEDSSYAAGVVEPNVRPVLAGISGDVNAVAHRIAVANGPGFAGAHPDDASIGGSDRNGANGGNGLLVANGIPAIATV